MIALKTRCILRCVGFAVDMSTNQSIDTRVSECLNQLIQEYQNALLTLTTPPLQLNTMINLTTTKAGKT